MGYIGFPIAWWQDGQQTFYARTISGSYVCAADSELKKCLEQLKSALIWKSENDHVQQPLFDQPNVKVLSVPIRTSELELGRKWPAKEMTYLDIPCVWGQRADESVVCNFPTLGTSFRCDDEKTFHEMAVQQAQSELNGLSQDELSEFLPVGKIEVTTLNVRLNEFKERDGDHVSEALQSVASPLVGRAVKKQFNRAWCRQSEIDALARQIALPRGNILLLGPHGVGKSTILMWAAREVFKQQRERAKAAGEKSKQPTMPGIWLSSADRIVAGMQYLGQWEERLEAVISELAEIQGVLCFERLDSLLRFGGEDASSSVASFLAPFLQNRELRVVVEATREELDRCRMLLPGFENLFQIFEIEPLNQADSWNVLNKFALDRKRNFRLGFEKESADLCIRLFRRFLPYDTFPGKCVGFWKGLFEKAQRAKQEEVTCDQVVSAFMDLTGLPEELIRDQVRLSADDVQQWFQKRIIGQPQACQSLTNVITTFKAGLNDPKKPVGVMLFCGPTGVGKTETVKALTDFMFGNAAAQSETEKRALVQQRLVRLDMSEFSGPGAGQQLTLQSDGQPGELVKRLRQQPFSIVLLDEIEKASPEVFDVLMGVLDEGRLTDRWGRVTDFRSSIIIMTSNLGVKSKEATGFVSESDPGFEASVKKFFRPEFFNRIDQVVPFNALDRESIATIAELELRNVATREGLQSRAVTLKWDDDVVAFLVDRGYSQKLGARPLQRAIENHVSVPLARLFAERPRVGKCELRLVVDGDQITVG